MKNFCAGQLGGESARLSDDLLMNPATTVKHLRIYLCVASLALLPVTSCAPPRKEVDHVRATVNPCDHHCCHSARRLHVRVPPLHSQQQGWHCGEARQWSWVG